jgi:hypothetical protein
VDDATRKQAATSTVSISGKQSSPDDVASAIAELLAVGFWRPTEHGNGALHHMEHQPDPEVIAKRRYLSHRAKPQPAAEGRTRR